MKKKYVLRSCALLQILLLTGCAGKQIEFLGCDWKIPSSFKQRSDGTYYGAIDDQDYINIQFASEKAELTSGAYIHVGNIDHKYLSIQLYESAKDTAMPGIPVYIASRDNFNGAVLVVNSPIENFIKQCN